ncbi:MAG: hypothetical protein UHU19_13105 [Lachnospiraceae bacterium]|nr:hypothetical protein [Lachnospiraceae bacterium]
MWEDSLSLTRLVRRNPFTGGFLITSLPQSEFGRQGSNRDFVMYPLRNARKYARNSFPDGTEVLDCRNEAKT